MDGRLFLLRIFQSKTCLSSSSSSAFRSTGRKGLQQQLLVRSCATIGNNRQNPIAFQSAASIKLSKEIERAFQHRKYAEVCALLDQPISSSSWNKDVMSAVQCLREAGYSSRLPLTRQLYELMARALVREERLDDGLELLQEARVREGISQSSLARSYQRILRSLQKMRVVPSSRRRMEDCLKVWNAMMSQRIPPGGAGYLPLLECLGRLTNGRYYEEVEIHIKRLLEHIRQDASLSIERKVILYGVGLKGLNGDTCLQVLEEMHAANLPVDEIHLGIVLTALANEGRVERCRKLLDEVQPKYEVQLNTLHINAAFLALFRQIELKSSSTSSSSPSSSLSSLPSSPSWETALALMQVLQRRGFSPSKYIIVNTLLVCGKGGAWPAAMMLFDDALLNMQPELRDRALVTSLMEVLDEHALNLFGVQIFLAAERAGVISRWHRRDELIVDFHRHTTKMARQALRIIFEELTPEELLARDKDLKIITGRGSTTRRSMKRLKRRADLGVLYTYVRSLLREIMPRPGALYKSSPGCLGVSRKDLLIALNRKAHKKLSK